MLPYGRQCIEEDDIEAVAEVLRGDFLTTGPAVRRFEEALCAETGAKHAVACANGTAALHLAAMALGLGPGDAVIVPSLTFLATANAARYVGAEVVFADVDPDTGLIGAGHVEAALERCGALKPKAIFPVHLAGQCADIDSLKSFGLSIVTDASHAIGSTYKGGAVGGCVHEDLTTFSFHPVKTVAMGEGGAITTNDDALAEKMLRYRTHGMRQRPDLGPWVYDMEEVGYNYRASDIHCALGASQMRKLKRFAARRRELVALYDRLLEPLGNLVRPPARAAECDPVWHLYSVRIDFAVVGKTRAGVMTALRERGIGTQVHYIPVHTQPYYAARYGAPDLPGAQHYYERTLSLPLYPSLADGDVERVAATLKEILS